MAWWNIHKNRKTESTAKSVEDNTVTVGKNIQPLKSLDGYETIEIDGDDWYKVNDDTIMRIEEKENKYRFLLRVPIDKKMTSFIKSYYGTAFFYNLFDVDEQYKYYQTDWIFR